MPDPIDREARPRRSRRLHRATTAALLCTVLTGCAPSGPERVDLGGADFVIRGGTVVDPATGRVLRDANVHVRQGVIQMVDVGGAMPTAGKVVLDATGHTVVPGFIDTHVHVATDPAGADADARERLRAAFAAGITTVRDMAGDARSLRDLATWASDSLVDAPSVRYSSLVAGPSFFEDPRPQSSAAGEVAGEVAWLRAVAPETDVVEVVSDAESTGATGLKLYADLEPATLTRTVAVARENGFPTWSHATVYPARPRDAVAASVDVLSHAYYLVWEALEPVPPTYAAGRRALAELIVLPDPRDRRLVELFDAMAASDQMLEPTLWVPFRSGAFDGLQRWSGDVTRLAHERGVRLVAGTDRMIVEDGSANLAAEMQLLVQEAGLTPLEALRAATVHAAAALGLEAELGSIAPGRTADLVVLEADPLVDIANTRRVSVVVKAGQPYRVVY